MSEQDNGGPALRPILFSAPMVRALLAGTKTQTRRPLRSGTWWTPEHGVIRMAPAGLACTGFALVPCPYGKPGDRLWVRETFAKIDGQTQPWIETDYRATYKHGARLGDALGIKKRWTPAIHMPRAASRITLEVTSVRVDRLQDISEADACAEGVDLQPRLVGYSKASGCRWGPQDPRAAFCDLWEQINGRGSWEANPWVWVVEFRRIQQEDRSNA